MPKHQTQRPLRRSRVSSLTLPLSSSPRVQRRLSHTKVLAPRRPSSSTSTRRLVPTVPLVVASTQPLALLRHLTLLFPSSLVARLWPRSPRRSPRQPLDSRTSTPNTTSRSWTSFRRTLDTSRRSPRDFSLSSARVASHLRRLTISSSAATFSADSRPRSMKPSRSCRLVLERG